MRRRFFLYLGLCGVLWGFTLETSEYARLDVTPQNPTATFYWNGNALSNVSDMDKFQGGTWAGLSEHDFMGSLLTLAVKQWNSVQGSYLRFVVVEDSSAAENSNDKRHAIVVKTSSDVATAAYASPIIEGNRIVDCDIVINDSKTTASYLAQVLVHEMGHCVGLGHNHSNYKAIMGYSRGPGSYKLAVDDMAGVRYLYPDPATGSLSTTAIQQLACGVIGGKGDFFLISWLFLSLPCLLSLAMKETARRGVGKLRSWFPTKRRKETTS